MPIKNWSTTASNNNSAAPNGFPEGMPPSGLNDSARQVMADVRAWYEDPCWADLGHTPTRISSTQFSVTGDQTAFYTSGRRVRLSGSATAYAAIDTAVYSSVTTVTLSTAVVPATLTAVALATVDTNSTPASGSGPGSGLDADTVDGLHAASFQLASGYTAADVLAKLLTVDGASSGVDADLLDGQHGSYYLPAGSYTAADVLSKMLTVDGATSGLDADLLDGQHGSYYLASTSYTAADVLAKLVTVDGAGSGIDADRLDGQHGSYYLAATSYTAADVLAKLVTVDGPGSGIDADSVDGIAGSAIVRTVNSTAPDGAGNVDVSGENNTWNARATSATVAANTKNLVTGNSVTITLPASPADGNYVEVANGASVTGCIIGRNGKKIMGLTSNMTIDIENFAIRLIYRAATTDWRLA